MQASIDFIIQEKIIFKEIIITDKHNLNIQV